LALAGLVVRCGQEPISGPQEITSLPRQLEEGETALVAADNAFGLKLFREIHAGEDGENIFIAPLSVGMALGMAYNGADGTTKEAMRVTLELQGLELPEVNESYRTLIDLLRDLDPAVEFRIANSIWYDPAYTFEQDFLQVNRDYFDAEVTGLDFADPGAAPTINNWVDRNTNGRISEIVDSPISPELVMFLINAIYFKGDWTNPFDEELTREGTFTLADGSEKSVEMMSYSQPDTVAAYFDGNAGVQVLDMKYGGKAYSMTIVMPQQPADIDALVEGLNSEAWGRWIGGLAETRAQVTMPKFTLEYDIELNEALRALGMEVAFDPSNADFTKIYSGGERLYISKVKHKTFVDVNEKGTEAAAATSVEIGVTSLPPMIVVDKPFVFAIREKFSGAILFLGVMVDPGRV
jgi:serpin B